MSNLEDTTVVSVIGAGLAGCEAAYQLAMQGIPVDLYEMKPHKYTQAHSYPGFAELVCSNSLKAIRVESAAGLLKAEMRLLSSLTLRAAESTAVPAGGALAVERELFSDFITSQIRSNPLIRIIDGEVTELPDGICVIATGPLTSDSLSEALTRLLESKGLSFYDAAAPIVVAKSVNTEIAFLASRYGKGEDDYLNCPMNKEEYERFYKELVLAESAELHAFDKQEFKVYEGCMPIEVMAKRGEDTIRFGPLKPVGLRDPRTGNRPWAVVQLRVENSAKSLYNMVGFQTNLKFSEQKRVFSLIPGLENAEFARYGVMHRNTFIDSPRLIDSSFCLKKNPNIYFAGQITGVEGYMESASSGLLVGHHLARRLKGRPPLLLPPETMLGAISRYVSDQGVIDFQPMGANMGILPPLEEPVRDKKLRYQALAERSISLMTESLL